MKYLHTSYNGFNHQSSVRREILDSNALTYFICAQQERLKKGRVKQELGNRLERGIKEKEKKLNILIRVPINPIYILTQNMSSMPTPRHDLRLVIFLGLDTLL